MFQPRSLFLLALAACILPASLAVHAVSQTAAAVPPPEAFRVLPPPDAEGPQITPYLLYQTSHAWQLNVARQARWSQVKTPADLAHLRDELRASLLDAIGGLPTEKTPLHATITGRVQGQGFHVEKLLYQSLPGYYVTALVYVPEDGAKVHPAVLFAAGHSPKGKIYYQDICQRLVKRGYLVISWDPVGQGERSQFWDAAAHKSRYNLICAEHAVMGNLAYLAGASLARWEVWDGMRAVDYLLTRSDVDPQRINLTGTSGGGFQTALLGALDQRIKVIIPSCYITALAMRVENRIFVDPDSDPEQDPDGLLSRGIDHAGLLLLMYPRAVMVATAAQDFFPVQGAHLSYSEVRDFYARFGHADRIGFAESYNQHQYSLKNQAEAIEFLDRFNGMPVRHGLPPVTLFKESDLLVTKSGQVSVDYPNAQPLTRFIAAYAAKASRTSTTTLAQLYHSAEDPHVASWTVGRYQGAAPSHSLMWEPVGASTFDSIHIDRYVLHHDTYLAMPLLHFHKNGTASKGPLLWLNINDKAGAKDWPALTKLLDQGYDIYSFDFRGLGETRMNYRARSSDDPDLVQGSFEQAYVNPLSSVMADYVYNSVLNGRPYFLQMIDDIEIASRFIRDQHRGDIRPLTIAAKGDAYALATRYKEINPNVKLLPSPASQPLNWSSLVAHEQEQWPIVFLLPHGAEIH